MNNANRIILAVLLPLLFLFLITLSLPFGSSSTAAAAVQAQATATPAVALADNLDDSSKVFDASGNLRTDSSFSEQMDGDIKRVIPITNTAEPAWMVWRVDADGVREFQAATYHLTDRDIVDFRFYVSSDNATFTQITPTVVIPFSAEWARVRYSFVPPPGMDYVKVEFPGDSFDRNPRQLGAISFNDPIPFISNVTPSTGPNDRPVSLDIYGAHFTPDSMGYLVGVTETWRIIPLEGLLYVDDYQLQATLPVTLTERLYHVKVMNPAGSATYRVNGYEVLDGARFHDLSADVFDLIIEPLVLVEGDSTTPEVQLAVRRRGGQSPLASVDVKFYDGDPAQGGILFGVGSATSVHPYSQTLSSAVPWEPLGAGEYTIYAAIDPDGEVAEVDETNNVISRTVTIEYLPAQSDNLAPQVDSFQINGGQSITSDRTVLLTTSASDNPTTGAVASVFYLEYEFVQGLGDWFPVAYSDSDADGAPDWVPFDSAQAADGVQWTLTPSPGLHYLQVWVADAYGNVSVAPGAAIINLLPAVGSALAPATILQDEVHIYRQELSAGESLQVTLTSISGDADLYIWRPDGTAEAVQETTTPTESIGFTAATAGTYQIEVAGFTNAEYTLDIILNPGKIATGDGVNAIMGRPRSDPLALPNNTPGSDVGLPQAPITITELYLPIMIE